MFQTVTKALVILLLARYSKCQRRIVNGERIDKSYVVYIVWDLSDEKLNEFRDTTTICGGFLLNELMVLTAASCLKIFPIQYVIAGYNKYVPGAVGRDQKEKECLEIAKKPIIQKCYHKKRGHTFGHGWQYYDLSIAVLETAYDFNDISFKEKCSYQPTIANYQYRTLEVGTDVVAFGWGSKHYHRPANEHFDINEDFLMGTATKIIRLDDCNRNYNHTVINSGRFRFCTEDSASIDIYGQPTGYRRANTNNHTESEPLYALDVPGVPGNETIVLTKNLRNSTRRNGPCQNDHGGPIATWENGTEIVIGIITGYLVNKNMECVSPFLYTVLTVYKQFIECTLKKFSS